MKRLRLSLEHCYGIKKLDHEFDFSQASAFAIYAPNGAMKSSFAETFRDLALGTDTRDRIFPDRQSRREILDESGKPIPPENVLVIAPYDEEFGLSEQTSTLLVDSALRKEHERLHKEIDRLKKLFLRALKEQSHSKKDLEKEVSATFTPTDTQFYRALGRVREEVAAQTDAPFADIRYDTLFDERVLAFLDTKDFKIAIKAYVEQYNELLDRSPYFTRGTFNYYNAATIAKSLAANGFFDAKHVVRFNAEESIDINTVEELETLIKQEKDQITNDEGLKRQFAEIERLLTKNVSLRAFWDYVAEHEFLLPRLENIGSLREDIWKSYFKAQEPLFSKLIDTYKSTEKRQGEIERAAEAQRTQWESVIEIFNDRFFVPFRLAATNRVSVILGDESILQLGFTFQDGAETASVEKPTLMRTLSTGEKKALYVLNIIFEVEVRRKTKRETLFIVDDIADSFDYKNKYAIIQYLMDIAGNEHFKQILLTHNFDFFRTVNSRFVGYPQCLMAVRSDTGIAISQAVGIKNIFVRDWKERFFVDSKKRVASIPFLRNLIEYTKGEDDPDFLKLTSLLHWKSDSVMITQGDLDSIYNRMFGTTGASGDPGASVTDLVKNEAQSCLNANDGVNFENKIVLSIAIRLAAERFMVDRINDPGFFGGITANQSQRLLERFRADFGTELAAIDIIERVVLMTPENIHLNSFMYEPILDMSDDHLKKLYSDVLALK